MQKYSVRPSDIHLSDGDCCKMVCTRVYRASEVDARIAELEKALHEFLRVCESAVPIKFLDELGVAADMARKAMSSRL